MQWNIRKQILLKEKHLGKRIEPFFFGNCLMICKFLQLLLYEIADSLLLATKLTYQLSAATCKSSNLNEFDLVLFVKIFE